MCEGDQGPSGPLVFTAGALSTHADERKMCDLQNTEAPASQDAPASFANPSGLSGPPNCLLPTLLTSMGPGEPEVGMPAPEWPSVGSAAPSRVCQPHAGLTRPPDRCHGESLSEGRLWRVAGCCRERNGWAMSVGGRPGQVADVAKESSGTHCWTLETERLEGRVTSPAPPPLPLSRGSRQTNLPPSASQHAHQPVAQSPAPSPLGG